LSNIYIYKPLIAKHLPRLSPRSDLHNSSNTNTTTSSQSPRNSRALL
jgi:hypothetical protein